MALNFTLKAPMKTDDRNNALLKGIIESTGGYVPPVIVQQKKKRRIQAPVPPAPPLAYGKMRLTVRDVTPELALAMLEKNETNRQMRRRVVDQYARDMAKGVWYAKPVAVCLDEKGCVVNGQHTLAAIVQSRITQRLLIAENTPLEAVLAMDVGVKRTVSDLAHFVGADMKARDAAIVRILCYGIEDNVVRSFTELFEGYQDHMESINFVSSYGAVGFNAAILAVVAMAWYTDDREKLASFLQLMKDGVSSGRGADKSVILLRDFIRSLKGGATRASKIEIYFKTQSALSAYLDGRGLTKLYATTQPRFHPPKLKNPILVADQAKAAA